MHTTGDSGVSRLVSVLLSSASLSLSLLLSLTKHTCRFTPLCSLGGKKNTQRVKNMREKMRLFSRTLKMSFCHNETYIGRQGNYRLSYNIKTNNMEWNASIYIYTYIYITLVWSKVFNLILNRMILVGVSKKCIHAERKEWKAERPGNIREKSSIIYTIV